MSAFKEGSLRTSASERRSSRFPSPLPSLDPPHFEPLQWEPDVPFSYTWPNGVHEGYAEAWRGQGRWNEKPVALLIGFTVRKSAGRDRPRAVVFHLSGTSKRYPLVEFIAGNAFEDDSRMASVLKTEEGKYVKPGAALPPGYENFTVEDFDTVVIGPYAARSRAVIATRNDLNSMAHHGLLRLQQKQKATP